MKIDLIIFDCDGVLVDSEPISTRIFTQMLNEIGIDINEELATSLFKGKSMKSCKTVVKNNFDREISDKFIKKFRNRTNKQFKMDLKPVPGIHRILQNISYPICVASSGSYKKMEITLKITGLKKYFKENIFSSSEVKRGKPFPDIFLFAAKKCVLNLRIV